MGKSRSTPQNGRGRPSQPVLAFRAKLVPDIGVGLWEPAWKDWGDQPLVIPRAADPVEHGADYRRFLAQPDRNFIIRCATAPELREADFRGLEIRLPVAWTWFVVARRCSLSALVARDDAGEDPSWSDAMGCALWLMAVGDCRGPHIIGGI